MKVNKVNKILWYYCSAVHSLEEERDKCSITNIKCKICSSYHVREHRMKEESWEASQEKGLWLERNR